MADEGWRRHRADEIFGEEQTPWFARAAQEAPRFVRAEVLPMPRPAAPAAPSPIPPAPMPTVAALPDPPIVLTELPSTPVASSASAQRAIAPKRFLLLALAIVLPLAIVAGWLARSIVAAPPREQVATSVSLAPILSRPLAVAPPPAAVPAPAPKPTPVAVAPAAVAPSVVSKPKRVRRVEAAAKREAAAVTKRSPALTKPKVRANLAERPVAKAVTTKTRMPKTSSPRNGSATDRAPRQAVSARPSFNCRDTQGEVTRLICSDRGLSALDRRLSARFADLDRSVDKATVQRIHRGETTFLNRRQSCATAECLDAAYRDRLRDLGEGGR